MGGGLGPRWAGTRRSAATGGTKGPPPGEGGRIAAGIPMDVVFSSLGGLHKLEPKSGGDSGLLAVRIFRLKVWGNTEFPARERYVG